MKLNEMNFSQYPDKLPSFMMKYGNEMITSYLETDEEMMEHDPDNLIKYYKLYNTEDSDSYAYLDSVEQRILEIFRDDSPLIEALCTNRKYFIQAMKGCMSDLLLGLLSEARDLDRGLPDFEDYTIYDFARALNMLAISVCLKNREDEIEEHCDMINDYMDQTIAVKNNPRYESIRRNRKRNTYR